MGLLQVHLGSMEEGIACSSLWQEGGLPGGGKGGDAGAGVPDSSSQRCSPTALGISSRHEMEMISRGLTAPARSCVSGFPPFLLPQPFHQRLGPGAGKGHAEAQCRGTLAWDPGEPGRSEGRGVRSPQETLQGTSPHSGCPSSRRRCFQPNSLYNG